MIDFHHKFKLMVIHRVQFFCKNVQFTQMARISMRCKLSKRQQGSLIDLVFTFKL